jgi:hypothetical protein
MNNFIDECFEEYDTTRSAAASFYYHNIHLWRAPADIENPQSAIQVRAGDRQENAALCLNAWLFEPIPGGKGLRQVHPEEGTGVQPTSSTFLSVG